MGPSKESTYAERFSSSTTTLICFDDLWSLGRDMDIDLL